MKQHSIVWGCRFSAMPANVAAVCILLSVSVAIGAGEELPAQAGQEGLFVLPGEPPDKQPTDSEFRYEVKLDQEKFYLFVPPNYRGKERFGLIVFIHAGDQMNVPADWKKMLTNHKLLYIAPQDIGNDKPVARRVSVSLVAIYKMMELYDVDPQRIFVAGHSGGAKVACVLAYTEPDLIRGVFGNCAAILPSDAVVDEDSLKKIKSQIGIVMVTGPKDFNHDGIVSIHNRLAAEHYRVKLLDVADMGHQLARAATFSAALDWLEGREKPADSEKHAKPKETKKTL